jgi:hypothetical protein
MAVQNVLVQISIPGAPSTAVLTTNITRFTVAAVESVAGPATNRRVAQEKVAATFPPIVGFLIGCAAGCFLEWQIGLPALLLPVLLSLAALLVNVHCLDDVYACRMVKKRSNLPEATCREETMRRVDRHKWTLPGRRTLEHDRPDSAAPYNHNRSGVCNFEEWTPALTTTRQWPPSYERGAAS